MGIKDYRIGVYVRVAHKDDEALKRQEEYVLSYCKYRDYPDVVKVYRDNGKSGTTENRPAYKRLLKDVRDGKINVILVVNFERLTRQPVYFFHKMIDYIIKKKLIVIAVNQSPLSDEELFNLRFMSFCSYAKKELENGGVE
ncbi:MAG: recombinase family protein [Clostridia bacterium]|nr:recombinase family protein [Clostridia bacterium]